MFAIIKFKDKQLKVEENLEYQMPFYNCKEGDKFLASEILLVSDDKKITVGQKDLAKASVEGTVVACGQDKKVSVIKFHSKKRYQKIGSHRQDWVKVKIEKISL